MSLKYRVRETASVPKTTWALVHTPVDQNKLTPCLLPLCMLLHVKMGNHHAVNELRLCLIKANQAVLRCYKVVISLCED